MADKEKKGNTEIKTFEYLKNKKSFLVLYNWMICSVTMPS